MSGRGLTVGGRIDRYVARLFLTSFATALLIVVGLFLVFDVATNLDSFVEPLKDGTKMPGSLIVRYYVLTIPFLYLQAGPFVTLLAGMFTVSKLLKHNETTAALAAGVSARRLLAPVVVGAVLAAAGMFALRETLASTLANDRERVLYVLENKQTDQVYTGVHMRTLNGSVVTLSEFRPRTGKPPVAEARGLSVISSVSQLWQINADRAVFVRKSDGSASWQLEKGVRKDFAGEQPVDELEGFDFTPDLVLTYCRAAGPAHVLDLSYSEARELAQRSPDDRLYQMVLQYHVTFPLGNIVLVLIGLPLLMHHERRRGARNLAAGSCLCILYFAADFVFRKLGMENALEPKMAAWMPILVFGSLGIVLFDSMKS